MKWIMVANSNDCRIYEYDKNVKQLTLIDEIYHPENKLKVHDFVTDHSGHYKSGGSSRGSYEPEMNLKDVAIDSFAREMAMRLDVGRTKHAYDDLTLLMPPAMEGLLTKHLNKHIMSSIHRIIQKNLMHLSEYELKKYLCKALINGGVMH
ncbi:MAG: host attachment protein [Legionellaceae bacterium]|nr:host attachment protein [Legionellaceae bacterium]